MKGHYASRTFNWSGGEGYHFYCPNEDHYYICNGQRVRYGYDNGPYCSAREEKMEMEEFIAIYGYEKCPFCGELLKKESKR